MARKTFLNWLFSEDKKPLYEDRTTGHILEADGATFKKPDDQPAHLVHDPSGWKDTLVKYARNPKYLGLFRDMTVPLKFVGDGAKILRNRMWTYGIECVCYFGIHKLDRLNYPYKYDPWYSCEIDFSKFKQGKTSVTVNAMEGGPGKYLKAYEGTTYEIPINTDPEKKLVYLDGLPFTNTVEYSIFDQDILPDIFVGGHDSWQVGMGIISSEGTTQGVVAKDQQLQPYPTFDLANNFINSISKNITVHITGELDFTALAGKTTTGISIQKFDAAGTMLESHDIYTLAEVLENSVNKIPYTFDIDLAPGESIFLDEAINSDGSHIGYIHINSSSLKLTYEVKFTPTFAECLTPYRAFEQIVYKMTEGKYGVKSSFLQSIGDDFFLTSGPALRKYGSISVLKTSLTDFFQSFKRFGVGLGIENDKIILEKHDYFFKTDIAIDLGEIQYGDDLVEVAEDLVINTIKCGYKNQKIDSVNGRDEINVTQQYTTPLTRIVKELDLVSIYRADIYGVQVTMVDLEGKDTTDNVADQDVFMLSVAKGYTYDYWIGDFDVAGPTSIRINKELSNIRVGDFMTISGAASNNGTYQIGGFGASGGTTVIVFVGSPLIGTPSLNGTLSITNTDGYRLNRPAYSLITGVLHPESIFNTLLSPKIGLNNNGAYLHSVLDYLDIKQITFQSGEKNSELSTTIGSITVTEKSNVPIGSLPPKLFLPYYFNIETKVDANVFDLLKNNPYSRISFIVSGNKYYGYMWDGGIKPGNNDKQKWKLLAAPNNDLSKFIKNA